MLRRLPRSKPSSRPIAGPMPSSIRQIIRAISRRPILIYGSGFEILRSTRSAERNGRLRGPFPLQHRENPGHRRAIFHAKKRLVQISDVEAGGSRGVAHMIGVMFIAAGVRQMKGITIAAFHAQCENAAGLEPFGSSGHDRKYIAEIDDAVAGRDKIETLGSVFEPLRDLADLEPVIDVALGRKLNHLRRKIDARHVSRPRLQAHAGKPRSAAKIEHREAGRISDDGTDSLAEMLGSLIFQVLEHPRLVARGESFIDLLNRPV